MDSFNSLVSGIQQLHNQLQQSAVNAVTQLLTIRNWLIGHHIVEFEQNRKVTHLGKKSDSTCYDLFGN